jgi:hypothetical protein
VRSTPRGRQATAEEIAAAAGFLASAHARPRPMLATSPARSSISPVAHGWADRGPLGPPDDEREVER